MVGIVSWGYSRNRIGNTFSSETCVIECQITIHCLKIWIFGARDYLKGMERVGGGVCDGNFSTLFYELRVSKSSLSYPSYRRIFTYVGILHQGSP